MEREIAKWAQSAINIMWTERYRSLNDGSRITGGYSWEGLPGGDITEDTPLPKIIRAFMEAKYRLGVYTQELGGIQVVELMRKICDDAIRDITDRATIPVDKLELEDLRAQVKELRRTILEVKRVVDK
jgi:hypothetical protein